MPDDFGTHVVGPRYLTQDVPGVGGKIKQRPEDFIVEEVPLYDPCGSGEHIYMLVEKRGMSSVELVSTLAAHFGVRRHQIGQAGLKDKWAVTRQVVSIHVPGKRPEDFPSLQHEKLTVMWVDLHTNKLKRGHLSGNRFSIKIRGVEPTGVVHALAAMRTLEQRGLPNRVGKQRFGYMLNNHEIGRCIITERYEEATRLLLGTGPLAPESQHEARALFDRGEYTAALDCFPRQFRNETLLLRALEQGCDFEEAWQRIDRTATGFYISAIQSAVFNAVLNHRIEDETFDKLLNGDLAFVMNRRRTFPIDETNQEIPRTLDRLQRFQISPSGPMWGSDMLRCTGEIDAMEREALASTGLTPADLDNAEARDLEMAGGGRRPLRVRVKDAEVEGGLDEHGPYIRCAFELPRGSFATTVLDEIIKEDPLREDRDRAARGGQQSPSGAPSEAADETVDDGPDHDGAGEDGR